MDSIADLPPVTAEPEPQLANPTPPPSSNGAHPPYSDMIIAAIAALKDKDGSSRQAIAKYIEKEYPNLPPTHPNLLTHHLKRMKNEGQLMMVKHSYMLPPARSVPFQPPTSAMEHHATDYSVTDTTAVENSSVQPRRKPGRPPKPRHEFGFQVQSDGNSAGEIHLYQPQFENHLGGGGQEFQSQTNLGASGPDLPSHYASGQEFQGNFAGGAEPIFVSLGLADDGVGSAAPPPANSVVSPKRGRGRPPKSGGISRSATTSSVEGGERRKRGRPRLLPLTMVNGGGAKRGVGRPRRIGGPVTVPLSGNVLRPRGRPRRRGRPAKNVSFNGGDGESRSVSRGRGRPPKSASVADMESQLTSHPFGIPSKDGSGTAVLVTDPQQLVAFQELKSKYEHLQSKAKEVLVVVRPYINSNSNISAYGAVQELETLVGMDASVSEVL